MQKLKYFYWNKSAQNNFPAKPHIAGYGSLSQNEVNFQSWEEEISRGFKSGK